MRFHREQAIIQLLRQVNVPVDPVNLSQMLFLLREETPSAGGSSFYEFLPFTGGPHSFLIDHELGKLEEEGLIRRNNSDEIALTDDGAKAKLHLPVDLLSDIAAISSKYGGTSKSDLRSSLDEKYSWYTMLEKPMERRKVKRPLAGPAIFTIGYQGFEIDGFLAKFLEIGITQLLDVRGHPTAREYGFHKTTLSKLCDKVGIAYLHLPEFGIPRDTRKNVKTDAEFDRLFDEYETNLDPKEVEKLAEMMEKKPSALVCLEADPNRCHRSRLAKAVAPVAELEIRNLVHD